MFPNNNKRTVPKRFHRIFSKNEFHVLRTITYDFFVTYSHHNPTTNLLFCYPTPYLTTSSANSIKRMQSPGSIPEAVLKKSPDFFATDSISLSERDDNRDQAEATSKFTSKECPSVCTKDKRIKRSASP